MSTEHPDRLSDEWVDHYATDHAVRRAYTASHVLALAREVKEWRQEFGGSALLNELLDSVTDDDVQVMRDHFSRTNADRRAIDALCARHDITVDGIVALVDAVFSPENDRRRDEMHPLVLTVATLRRLARQED